MGNIKANEFWESAIPPTVHKPTPKDTLYAIFDFLFYFYVFTLLSSPPFYPLSPPPSSSSSSPLPSPPFAHSLSCLLSLPLSLSYSEVKQHWIRKKYAERAFVDKALKGTLPPGDFKESSFSWEQPTGGLRSSTENVVAGSSEAISATGSIKGQCQREEEERKRTKRGEERRGERKRRGEEEIQERV